MIESNMVVKEKHCDPGTFSLRHKKMGHLWLRMMWMMIENVHGYLLKGQKFPPSSNTRPCTSCSLGKLIKNPSPMKVERESPRFRYFMVLIYASRKWSHVCLLSTLLCLSQNFLLKFLNYEHISLIILSKEWVLTMLVKLLPKHLMTIVYM